MGGVVYRTLWMWGVAAAFASNPAADIQDTARHVYERIVRATGVSGQPPRLIFHSESERRADKFKRQIAWYDHGANTVGMDQKTLDLCARMKDPAGCIAVFLGHELAHFYKDHRWGGDFGSRFPNTDLGVTIKALDAAGILIYETQADDVGGLYSYAAGYDTLALMPTVLDAVYAEYNLPAKLAGYPSLAERKQIANASAARLESMVPVFEAGTLLFALARYEDAGRCFDRVAQTFPGGAELNNAGVSYVLEAAALFPPDANAGGYPWTIDAKSRLQRQSVPQSRGAVAESREQKLKRLTAAAESRFSEAIRRDPAYVPAVLNLAFLDHLTGRRGTAKDLVAGLSSADPAVAASIRSAKAVVDVEGPPPPAATPLAAERVLSDESIGALKPSQITLKMLPAAVVLEPEASAQATLRIAGKRYPDYWAILVQSGPWRARALVTAGYKGETRRHIRLGTPWQDAIRAYSQAPVVEEPSSLGRMAVFDTFGIAFSGAATVEKWMVFSAGD